MRRRALVVLLALGTLAGYSSGFASLYRWRHQGPGYNHGGSCQHGRYGYDAPAPAWTPPQPPVAPAQQQAQAQAPAPNPGTPAEPGPR